MRKTLLALVAMTAVAVPILTSCGEADLTTAKSPVVEHSTAPNPEPAEAPTPAEEPEPVDPDKAFVDSVRSHPAVSGRMNQVVDEMHAFSDAAGSGDFAEGARTAHTVSGSFDWIADRMDADSTSADSPVAQNAMATFRQCRNAFDSASTALAEMDLDAMRAANDDMAECNRGMEGVRAQF